MFQALSSSNELIKSISQREEVSAAQEFVRSQVSFADATNAPTKFSGLATNGIEAALTILRNKGTADDATAYKSWVTDIADKISKSAKEGGFLGFGGELVSDGEAAFLSALKQSISTIA